MAEYFTAFAAECGVSVRRAVRASAQRADEPDDKFNMAVMGLRLAARSNGVARLHGAVSREMFQGLWPDLAVDEVPIGSITNGVHGRTWVSARVDALLTRVVGEDWPGADAERWARVRDVDPLEAWATLNDGRDELVRLARQRLGDDVLDPTRPDRRLRPPLRHLQAGDAAALRPGSTRASCCTTPSGRCSSCSPGRPTPPTRPARS